MKYFLYLTNHSTESWEGYRMKKRQFINYLSPRVSGCTKGYKEVAKATAIIAGR
jgi:hypothetical protein